ncbi:class I SAM-dependent methyltransferase [Piscinibacter sp. XHJ-5]|uniref:class I SAM-dependent methyltransferase n=1 Tax=Piscinibacter sp. XHJ-5 TaxID=3037797 RepID=UPI002453048C|nr:class I SAM-dependent methyltransferase [Piscinibacter sp. XHJ-5]
MAPTPDNLRSIEKYRRAARGYDSTTGPTWSIRMRCIELLELHAGDTVLDVGCGTGLSFEPLLERIGRNGLLIAFEQSPEMHAQAAQRAQRLRAKGWRIELQRASAEEVELPAHPDAALFHYVHDILRTPQALANLLAQLPPGTRLAVAGMKYFPWWLAPLNLLAWLKNLPYNVHAHELNRPWALLEQHLQGFTWKPTQGGMGYIGRGRVKGVDR